MQEISTSKAVAKSPDQQKKKPEITDYFYKGTYIDARENGSNYWSVAQVIMVDRDENLIKIKYDGMHSKYDEVLSYNLMKIRLFYIKELVIYILA